MSQNNNSINISWYGRCCFLIKYKDNSILFDPYDTYCNVDIGYIDADILISSSTWHDHGHIGASPQAYICTYPGVDIQNDIKIVGIQAKENRGTPTVVFNVAVGPYSITNFADFGPQEKDAFEKSLTDEYKKILQQTNIAFIRPSNEIALNYCQPKAIFPEHYFPKSFTQKQIPKSQQENFLRPIIEIDKMIKDLAYPVKEIVNHSVNLSLDDLKDTKIYKFLKLHPQVTYKK